MTQLCKDIIDYEGRYKVCSNGDILSLPNRNNKYKEIKLKQRLDVSGYPVVCLFKEKKKMLKVSRLVAIHFLTNPDNLPQVNHKNGIKENNNVSNLEWCTPSENLKHAFKIGLKSQVGEKNSRSKLKTNQIVYIRKSKLKQRELAERFNVDQTTISKIQNNNRWTFV